MFDLEISVFYKIGILKVKGIQLGKYHLDIHFMAFAYISLMRGSILIRKMGIRPLTELYGD